MIKNLIIGSFIFRFVGMSYLKPWRGLCINDDDNTMIFQTQQQMKFLAGYSPRELWIRGTAGSGKTYLLIEKALTLAQGILSDPTKTNEKILVLCCNPILRKALEKTINGYLQVPEARDVSSFLHCKTFTELVVELASLSWSPRNNIEKEMSVNWALGKLKEEDDVFMYDHILVDEGQDLYGTKWPTLLKHIHKGSKGSAQEARPGFFWVMYDVNQHLYLGKKSPRSHFDGIQNNAELNVVFRNTDNIFKQSKKYFKSSMSNGSPITLGHEVTGLPIEWDDSLASCSVIPEGTRLVVRLEKEIPQGARLEEEIPQGARLVVSGEEIQQGARLEEEILQGPRLEEEIPQGARLVVSGEEIPQGARLLVSGEEIQQGARLVVSGEEIQQGARLKEEIQQGARLKEEIQQGFRLVVSGEEIQQGARLKEEIQQGARLVVNWIEKLEKEKVLPKDICVLVQNQEKQRLLRDEIERIGWNSQTADDLLENSRNCAVVESIQRFKGLESKVVILFNPPFQGYSQFCTKELLYAAVSRCSCFLVVISSKEGCIALKSDDGINEVDRGQTGGPIALLRF